MTTETTVWAVLDRRLRVLDAMWLFVSGRPLLDPHTCVVGGWVGCGPYSGRFALTACSPPTQPRTCMVCVVVGVLLFVLAY